MGPVLGPFFLPKRVPLMVGPPRYSIVPLLLLPYLLTYLKHLKESILTGSYAYSE